MSALALGVGAGALALLAAGGSTLVGRGERRRLAERIASLRPAPSVAALARAAPRRARFAPLRALDPLLGIERATASDEPMPVFPWLLIGALAGGFAYTVFSVLLGLGGAFPWVLALGAGLFAARSGVAGARAGIRAKMEDEFSLALGVIIRCVRVGLPVTEGMRAVAGEVPAPTGPEFRACVDQVQLGEDFDAALVGLARRCALADYRFFAVSVALQRQTGGNLAETLENLAETIRKRKAIRLRAQALTSETKATVMVLSLLPIVVGGLLMLVRPDYIMTLFVTENGRLLLGVAAVVQAFGLAIIRMIIKRSLA